MPVDWSKYPSDWRARAMAIKEQAGWKCQACGQQCRRPSEPFDTHKRTLTVAHVEHGNHDGELLALCAPCHLRRDVKHHARTRRNRGQMMMVDALKGLLP